MSDSYMEALERVERRGKEERSELARLRVENEQLRAELIAYRGMGHTMQLQRELTELRTAAAAMRQLGPVCDCGECEWCKFDRVQGVPAPSEQSAIDEGAGPAVVAKAQRYKRSGEPDS